MTQYIDKDALVAKIKGRQSEHDEKKYDYASSDHFWASVEDGEILSLIDTLEVKEVDLKKDFFDWYHEEKNRDYNASILYERYSIISKKLAKHFFELGVNASNPLTWKDIDLILDITDQIANDDSMEEKLNNMSQEKYCIEVLKRFNAQKGEEV